MDVLLFGLWFYNPSYLHSSMAHTLLPRFRTPEAKGDLRIIMLSDDQHWLRAKQIGATRGDAIDYWEDLKVVESEILASPELDLVVSITEEDKLGHEELREKENPERDVGDFAPITVLPMIARRMQTPSDGFQYRNGVLFVGSGAFHNRMSVQVRISNTVAKRK